MLLGIDTSGTLYPLILAAAGLIVVVLALAKLATHLRRIALDSQPGLTDTGLTLQQIEQMYESGQISRQEFNLLRRRALADVLTPQLPAKPPAAAPAPTVPSQDQSPSPLPVAGPAGGEIVDLDATEQSRLRRQREDDSAIRTRRLLVVGLVILAAGLVWLGVYMHRQGGPSGGSDPGAGMRAGPASLPAQSTQPASRKAAPEPYLPPDSGPASQPETVP
jgi:hypothetical protein